MSYNLAKSNNINNINKIETLVQERNNLRLLKQYEKADALKLELEQDYEVQCIDFPGISWKFIDSKPIANDDDLKLLDKYIKERNINGFKNILIERDLRIGRRIVDYASTFAMYGVDDNDLYKLIYECGLAELNRFAHRKSCRTIDIIKFCEQLAISGERNQTLYQQAYSYIQNKENSKDYDCIEELNGGNYNLLQERALVNLFLKNSKLTKHSRTDGDSDEEEEFNEDEVEVKVDTNEEGEEEREEVDYAPSSLFTDPSKDLVMDLGCGFGIGLIDQATKMYIDNQDQEQECLYNYLGVELNPVCANYGNGISSRWGLSPYLSFVRDDCLSALEQMVSDNYNYKGKVAAISINFPSPFVEADKGDNRNKLLPLSKQNFLLTSHMVQLMKQLLKPDVGVLFLESNVADVALYMKDLCMQGGFVSYFNHDDADDEDKTATFVDTDINTNSNSNSNSDSTAWTGFGDYMESLGTPMSGGGNNANFEAMLEAALSAENSNSNANSKNKNKNEIDTKDIRSDNSGSSDKSKMKTCSLIKLAKTSSRSRDKRWLARVKEIKDLRKIIQTGWLEERPSDSGLVASTLTETEMHELIVTNNPVYRTILKL